MRISDWSSDVCSSDLAAASGACRDRSGLRTMGLRWGRSWLSSPIGGWSRDYPTIDTDASNASPRARRHSPQIQLLCYTLMDKFGGSSAVKGQDHGKLGRESCRERVCQYV